MNSKLEERKKFLINVLYFAVAAALLYFTVKYVLAWIFPFIIGFLVALLLKPAIRFLSKKLRMPDKLAAVILAILFYAVVGLLIVLLGTKLVSILIDGFSALPNIYTQYIDPLIQNSFDKFQDIIAKLDPDMVQSIEDITSSVSQAAGSVITGISSQVIKFLTTTVTSLPSFLLAVLLAVISSVFFVMDYSRITGSFMKMMPHKFRAYTLQLKKIGADVGLKYVKSYAILMSVTFIELSIGLMILGVDNAIAIAALIALIDLLPVLGTGGVVIPWILIELIKGNIGFGTGLAIMYAIITIVRNIIEPRIVGRQIGIHPLGMLISMYVGLRIFGFIGIFVLPICLVVVKSFYDNSKTDTLGSLSDR